jgi:hypothetical protein
MVFHFRVFGFKGELGNPQTGLGGHVRISFFCILTALTLLSGCTVVINPVEFRGSTSRYNYNTVPPVWETQWFIRKDDRGLVGFRMSQYNLTPPQVRVEEERLKNLISQCPNGAEKRSHDIEYTERKVGSPAYGWIERLARVNFDYVCIRPGR